MKLIRLRYICALNIRYIIKNLDPLFCDYSALEFESIVKLKPCKSQGNTPRLGAGHLSQVMFPLDPGHPLYGEYEAVIRVHFRTAVLAGHPPPTAGYCIFYSYQPTPEECVCRLATDYIPFWWTSIYHSCMNRFMIALIDKSERKIWFTSGTRTRST